VKTKEGKQVGEEERIPESEKLQGLRLLAILGQASEDLDHLVRQITSSCFPTKEQRAVAFIFWYLRFKAKGGISELRVEEWLASSDQVQTLKDSPLLVGLDRGELLKLAKTTLGSGMDIPTDPELVRIAISTLYETRKRNEVRDEAKKLLKLLDEGDKAGAEQTCRRIRLAGALDDKDVPVVPAHEGPALGQLARQLEARPEGLQGLATGFRELDDILGGIRPGRFYVLGGVSSAGKTSFLVQLLDQIATESSAKIVLFSLEQEADELRLKSLARASGVSINKLERKRGAEGQITAEEWAKVHEEASLTSGWRERITILDARLRTERLVSIAEGMAEPGRDLVIAVDYLQLLKPEKSDGSNVRGDLEETIIQLSRLARSAKCAVVALSSLSRASAKEIENDPNSATMTAFKESGMVEYSADVAMMLTEEGVADRRESDYKETGLVASAKRRIRLDVLKNRMGRTGRVKFSFVPELASFEDRDEEVI
jgi:hypothetical protein